MKFTLIYFLLLVNILSCKNRNNFEQTTFVGYYMENPVFKNQDGLLYYRKGKENIKLYELGNSENVLYAIHDFLISKKGGAYYYKNLRKSISKVLEFDGEPYNFSFNLKKRTLFYNLYSDENVRKLDFENFKASVVSLKGAVAASINENIYIAKESKKDTYYPLVDIYRINLNTFDKVILINNLLSGEDLFISPNEEFVIDRVLVEGQFRLYKVDLNDGDLIEKIKNDKYYYSFSKKDIVYY